MSSQNPSSNLQADATSGAATEQKSTSNAAWVTSRDSAASVDVNDNITADVDAAVAAATGLRLMGFCAREMAGTPAAAKAKIVHGATGAGGTVLVPITLAASQTLVVWFGDSGIACANGLSIDWVSGALDLELYYKTVA